MGKKQKDHFIARHTFEIRFKNRNLTFMDYKGEMGDYIIKKMDWENLKLTGSRFDIANNNFDKILFFSWENFGLQIEVSNDFEDFKDYINKLFEILDEFKKYKVGDISRIGIKSSIFYHKYGIGVDEVKSIYKNIMLKDSGVIEKKMGGKIVDTGFLAINMQSDAKFVNFTTGPMTKNEVISKIFKNDLYDSFNHKSGIYFDIDLSQKDLNFDNLDKLKEWALESSSSIEKKFKGFIDYFFSLDN
ncbi:hypothetical protein KKG22_04815 [Patescibacteria group bacterium]|nr:hypothetical protein [Patescibacteria group bacterium]MBU1721657.1 hypothetical protein [Patescibacteria group bacterium]MBU1900966.1 hypothetical protein [Patescibacteria group bacterium]